MCLKMVRSLLGFVTASILYLSFYTKQNLPDSIKLSSLENMSFRMKHVLSEPKPYYRKYLSVDFSLESREPLVIIVVHGILKG